MDIERIMARLPSNKGKRRNPNRVRGQYRKKQQRTQSELVRFLIEKDIRTTGQLRKRRQPSDPTLGDFIKTCGSWREAQTAAYGEAHLISNTPVQPSANYLIQCVNEFNLWKRSDWCAAHKRDPSIIPSLHFVRTHFQGSYRNLTWAASKLSAAKTMDRYLDLWIQMGKRVPTAIDCRHQDIDLSPLINERFYPNKKDLDKFAMQLICKMK